VDAPRLPYADLNLRQNPFGELTVDDWAALAQVEVDAIVAKLSDPKYVVQFVGEKGHGKTTHLLALRSRFTSAAYVHIPEGQRVQIPTGNPVLIDEAQRLTRWQQFSIFRPHAPLVLGTHHDFTKRLRLAGRTVETIHVQQSTDVHKLHRLVNARIAWARRTDGPLPSVTQQTAQELLQKFGPNIRGALHELYVTFQNLSQVCDV